MLQEQVDDNDASNDREVLNEREGVKFADCVEVDVWEGARDDVMELLDEAVIQTDFVVVNDIVLESVLGTDLVEDTLSEELDL